MEKLVRKGKYCETLKGKSPKEQVHWLKSEFSRVLLEDGVEEAEYNGRLDCCERGVVSPVPQPRS
eukprot:15469855-Alexandrium_andersonii.AAC.1